MIPDPSGQLAELIVYITSTRVDLYIHQILLKYHSIFFIQLLINTLDFDSPEVYMFFDVAKCIGHILQNMFYNLKKWWHLILVYCYLEINKFWRSEYIFTRPDGFMST